MSNGLTALSGAAERRIRVATTWVSVGASVMLTVIGIITIASGMPGVLGEGRGAGDYPWDAATPLAAQRDGSEWHADRSAYIELNAEEAADPQVITPVGAMDDGYVRLYADDPRDEIDRYYFPPSLGGIYSADEQLLAIPFEHGVRIWVRSDGPWRLKVADLEAEEITDTYGGKGNAFLVYRGDALSAHVRFEGDGVFVFTIWTDEGDETPIIESDPVDTRVSWKLGRTVIFQVESDADRAAWFIDIDELASPSPSATPSESPSPGPTPDPASGTDPEGT